MEIVLGILENIKIFFLCLLVIFFVVKGKCTRREMIDAITGALLLFACVGWAKIANNTIFNHGEWGKEYLNIIFCSISLLIIVPRIFESWLAAGIFLTSIPLLMFVGRLFWENLFFLKIKGFVVNFAGTIFFLLIFIFLFKKGEKKWKKSKDSEF